MLFQNAAIEVWFKNKDGKEYAPTTYHNYIKKCIFLKTADSSDALFQRYTLKFGRLSYGSRYF